MRERETIEREVVAVGKAHGSKPLHSEYGELVALRMGVTNVAAMIVLCRCWNLL